MRTTLIATILLASVPAISHAQSDLRKIGRFLDDMQRLQNQGQGRPNNGGNNNGTRAVPYKIDPNSSGNQNAGGFHDNNLFGPQGGGGFNNNINHNHRNNFPPQNRYPQNNFHQGHNHNQYPNNISPNYNRYPGTVQNHNTVPYTPPSQSAARPVYADPPIAPKVYSKLPIVIRCAPDCTGTCNYNLLSASGKSYPYTIRAGQTQNLKETTDWKFSYRPDGSTSQAYALRGGRTYELRQNAGNWQFYLVP